MVRVVGQDIREQLAALRRWGEHVGKERASEPFRSLKIRKKRRDLFGKHAAKDRADSFCERR